MTGTQPAIDLVRGGAPAMPQLVTVPMFGADYPVLHGGAIYVTLDDTFDKAIIAVGRSDIQPGLFVSLDADMARSVAGWLLRAAGQLDARSNPQ